MMGPFWVVLNLCVASAGLASVTDGRICSDHVFAQSVDTIQICMLVAGDISRIYEGSNHPRCMSGAKPDLPDISFAATDRYG